MRYSIIKHCLCSLLLITFLNTSFAAINPAASEVALDLNCAGADNCFSTWDDLSLWIDGTRNPTKVTPLTVNIGPGEFIDSTNVAGQQSTSMTLDCVSTATTGWIHFQGAGREQTRLVGTLFSALWIQGCDSLEFQDLTVEGRTGEGIGWNGTGSSTWTNVNLEAVDLVWVDFCSPEYTDAVQAYFVAVPVNPTASDKSEHFFFNVKMTKGTFSSYCAVNWLYGSDLAAEVAAGQQRNSTVMAIHHGDIRLFGSTVRSWSAPGDASEVVGVTIKDNAHFHMHGGIINVNSTAGTGNAIAIHMNGKAAALAHVVDTAFAMSASPEKQTIRIFNESPGRIQAPFLWQPSLNPPGVNLASTIGQDMYIEQDCDSTGDCSGSCADNTDELCQPHIMIYNQACSSTYGSPWFNSTVNKCRQN